MRHLHVLLTGLAISASSLCTITPAAAQTADVTPSRGIGIYPGDPAQYAGPQMLPGGSARRNLALHRAAYTSSAYDANLTAQLLTDGITLAEGTALHAIPRLRVSTPQGELPAREREWSIDQTPFSKLVVVGDDTYVQYDFIGYRPEAASLTVNGTVAYEEALATEGYALTVEVLGTDGVWHEVATRCSTTLPGTVSRWKAHSDPNKQSARGTLPVRTWTETLTLKDPESLQHHETAGSTASPESPDGLSIRLNLRMRGAAHWSLTTFELGDGSKDAAARKMPFDTTAPDHLRPASRYINTWYPTEPPAGRLAPADHFCSAWLSAAQCVEEPEEWAYVDLGATSTIDEVRLHWVGSPAATRFSTSEDATTWSPVTAWPAHGRYVRATFTRPADQDVIAVSEMEVWGTGGIVAAPTGWTVQREGSDLQLPATVPGTVLASYINAGAVPDPSTAHNVQYISDAYFNANFIYRHDLAIPTDLAPEEHLWLNFDGINWRARVYLADELVGHIDGAFTRAQFDITAQARAAATATLPLRVEIERCAHPGSVKEKSALNTDFNGGILGADNPTFHASIGWDWITTVRGRNIGIWRDVYTRRTGAVTVHDPYVATHLTADGTALVTPEVIVRNHSMQRQVTTVTGHIGTTTFSRTVTLNPLDARTLRFTPEEFPALAMEHPALWWPNGYGEPTLHDAGFKAVTEGGTSDAIDFKAGLREMTYSETDDVLKLYINGRRFVGRGGNWGFAEHNLSYRAREYDIAVRYHRDMHFTMIRNWVGQTGDVEFYEACDRYGIMVWQDFWLANPSDGPEPADEAMFLANAEDYAYKIRRHPSLGLWCGRNEGYPPLTLDRALRRLTLEATPGIHYIGSSADEVVSGHGPYRALPPREYFAMTAGRDKIHSERGMPAVMNYGSTLRALGSEGLFTGEPSAEVLRMWGLHDFTREGAQFGTTFYELLSTQYGVPRDTRQFCQLAQAINYDGYRALFESRSAKRKGLILWMTHPCWPSMVWQTYDYYFDPTGALFGARKACEPLHIQYNPQADSVEVVNYSAGDLPGLKADITLRRTDGTVIAHRKAKVHSTEDSTLPLAMPQHEVTGPYFLDLTLSSGKKGDSPLSTNRYLLQAEPALMDLSKPDLHVEEIAPGQVRLSVAEGSAPALLVHLQLLQPDGTEVLPVFWDDNYFHLLPGETRTITYDYAPADAAGHTPHVSVETLN